MALEEGHADAIRAFGEVLKRVPEESRGAVPAAKRADQLSGLLMALHNGRADSVRAFGELSSLVPEESRAELVAAEHPKKGGRPGLRAVPLLA